MNGIAILRPSLPDFKHTRSECYPKRRFVYGLHGAMSQKMATFVVTAVRTSDPTRALVYSDKSLGTNKIPCIHRDRRDAIRFLSRFLVARPTLSKNTLSDFIWRRFCVFLFPCLLLSVFHTRKRYDCQLLILYPDFEWVTLFHALWIGTKMSFGILKDKVVPLFN
jgi:hypothetical protein